jgi:hypothetical protein
MRQQNKKSGKFMGVLSDKDKLNLETVVAEGMTRRDFQQTMAEAFDVTYDCSSAWYYKAKKRKW